MPIPSRPLPTPAPRRAQAPSTATKPGSSMPRRARHFIDNVDMYDLPLPSSAPVRGMSGVRMINEKEQERVKEGWKGEVGIGELVAEGLGRREKRATTATSLGFDFIQNPTIMALPDHPSSTSNSITAVKGLVGTTAATPLGVTPNTPALIPTLPKDSDIDPDADVDEDEDEDDWEYITEFEDQSLKIKGEKVDDGDIIILGEMDLGDHAHVHGTGDSLDAGKDKKGYRRDKSYAAVVGTIE